MPNTGIDDNPLHDDMLMQQTMEAKILHSLTIYPIISPSMLQIGIGTHHAPTEWKPALRKLIQEGRVIQVTHDTKTVTGRNFSYTQLMLPKTYNNIPTA